MSASAPARLMKKSGSSCTIEFKRLPHEQSIHANLTGKRPSEEAVSVRPTS
jgi:hypothetical protein